VRNVENPSELAFDSPGVIIYRCEFLVEVIELTLYIVGFHIVTISGSAFPLRARKE
jgi:hypothetical protein